MKITLTEHLFIEEFKKIRPDNFTMVSLSHLYYWYEELEDAGEDQIEFDPIAICCEWCEFDTEQEAIDYYDLDNIEQLEDNTSIISTEEGKLLVMVY